MSNSCYINELILILEIKIWNDIEWMNFGPKIINLTRSMPNIDKFVYHVLQVIAFGLKAGKYKDTYDLKILICVYFTQNH